MLLVALLVAIVASVGLAAATRDDDTSTTAGSPTSTTQPAVESQVVESPAVIAARFAERPLSEDADALVRAVAATGDAAYAAHLVDLVRIGYSNIAADAAADVLAQLTGIERTGRYLDDYLDTSSWVLRNGPEPAEGYGAFKAALYYQVDDEFVPLLASVDDRRTLAAIQWGGVGVGAIRELNDPRRLPIGGVAWATAEERIFGMTGVDGTALAYPERILGRHELANDHLAGEPVVVSYCTLCRTPRAFDRRVAGRTLTFVTSGLLIRSNKIMLDRETSTLWQQLTGEAIAGPLKGQRLTELPLETTTLADWQARHPASAVVDKPDPLVIDPETGVPVAYDYEPDAAIEPYFESDGLWFPVLATPEVFPLKEPMGTLRLDGATFAVSLAEIARTGAQDVTVAGRPVRVEPAPVGVRFVDRTTGATLPSGQSFWFAWYGEYPETGWWSAVSGPRS